MFVMNENSVANMFEIQDGSQPAFFDINGDMK